MNLFFDRTQTTNLMKTKDFRKRKFYLKGRLKSHTVTFMLINKFF